jgi:hypothetical protein
MGYQKVLVDAWVFDGSDAHPDQGLPGQPPGIWGPNDPRPTPPIYFPPAGGGQPGVPTHPIYNPPGIWGPNDPRPTPPIYMPGQPPLGIWGPNDPRPNPPIYLPPNQPTVPGVPTHPIYNPPGIWGGGNVPMPTPPIYFPPSGGQPVYPSHPIYRPDLTPEHPIYNPPPSFPILEPDDMPQHPEVPDLNAGTWNYVSKDGQLVAAFIPYPLVVTHPDYNPTYPPAENQPGEWVAIYYYDANFNGLTWAWLPTIPEAAAPPEAAQLPS